MRRSVSIAALVAVLIVVVPLAASARTDDRSKPIVYVHGFDVFSATDCNMWNNMDSTMRTWGLTGEKASVQYYSSDSNCTYSEIHHGDHTKVNGSSHTTHNNGTAIEHLGYHLAWMIYDHFTAVNQPVDVVAHSMGGLVTRYAIYGVQAGLAYFPPRLLIEDVVTLATPHGGTAWAYGCGGSECTAMRPGSSFLNNLSANAPNPQAEGGTDWTTAGSDSDGIVSSGSAVSMSAAHKVIYLSSEGIGHSDYYNLTSDVRTADVNYQDFGGPWYAWYDAPYPVRWSDYSLWLSSW
jgi:hypothetical protein